MTRRLIAVLLLLPLAAQVATAQTRRDLHDWNNVVALDAETKVIVTLASGEKLVGEVRLAASDRLVIDIYASSPAATTRTIGFGRTIDRAEVKEVRKAKGSRLASALLWAGAGAGAGAALGGIGASQSENDEFDGLVTGLLVFTGALLGAAIGGSNPGKGKTIYVSP